MNDYIKVAKIVNTHGIKGCVKCVSLTDDVERFSELSHIYTEKDNKKRKISDAWYKKGLIFLELEGINDMDTAETFKETYISILEDQLRTLDEDTYYIFDLEGMDVFSTEGEFIGKISTVYQTGANDVYEVKNEKKVYLIPAIKNVVKDVNVKEKKMTINVIDGLLE